MKSDDLRLEELVAVSEGLLSLHGRRLILHDIHAMAQLREDLVESLGVETTRRILTRFGYFWGQADAAAMKRAFQWASLAEWLKAGPRLQSLQGATRAVVESLDFEPGGRFRMEIVWHRSAEAEVGRQAAKAPACWIMTGYSSGYASFCMETAVYFMERSCRALGDDLCRVVGMDRHSWGDEEARVSQYFKAEDIQARILGLTSELRRKTAELARHRRRLRHLESLQMPGMAPVRSRAFTRVVDLALRVARFDSSLLITGESGVGKEVLVRFIHGNSRRSGKPFIVINCSALPETLLEAELFGHRQGAFTGAVRNRAGLLEEAHGGTLLLDEIGDVPPSIQVKLLRVLQEKELRRLGDNVSRSVDVRLIAATHRNLEEEVRAGRFREDLLYRLKVVDIHIPPLRERPEDIVPLARFFIEQLSRRLGLPDLTLDATCLDLLQAHGWPGNVRELENALERAAVLSDGRRITPECLPPAVRAGGAPAQAGSAPGLSLDEVERRHVLSVLERAGGNRARAAVMLGISTTTLWRRLKAWKERDAATAGAAGAAGS